MNDIALEFIAEWEKFVAVAKQSKRGDLPTNGFGNTRGVKVGDKISYVKAFRILERQVRKACKDAKQLVKIQLSEFEEAALASLIFNVGRRAFKKSRALKALNHYCFDLFRFEVEDEKQGFVRLRKGGKPMKGLIRRRQEEMNLFFGEVNG